MDRHSPASRHSPEPRRSSKVRRALLVLTLVPILTACAAGAAATPTSNVVAAPTATPTDARPSYDLGSPPFQTVPPTAAPITGEVPAPLMDLARADLARRTGLDPSTFTVVRSETAIWADGSLGCPIPGQLYTQVQTPGYWIVLEAAGKPYDYRATSGAVRLCELANPKPPSG